MMCENKQKKPIEKVKEELQTSKEKLNKSLSEGEDKLCDFLTHLNIWKKESNKTPAG